MSPGVSESRCKIDAAGCLSPLPEAQDSSQENAAYSDTTTLASPLLAVATDKPATERDRDVSSRVHCHCACPLLAVVTVTHDSESAL